jgi:hypothetical protein
MAAPNYHFPDKKETVLEINWKSGLIKNH